MSDESFELWLEFEHWEAQESDDPEDEIFNMHVTLSSGKKYALNVWTYKSLWRMVKDCQETGECMRGAYLLPPDLFVQRLDRDLIEKIICDLITNDGLKEEWSISEDHDI